MQLPGLRRMRHDHADGRHDRRGYVVRFVLRDLLVGAD